MIEVRGLESIFGLKNLSAWGLSLGVLEIPGASKS